MVSAFETSQSSTAPSSTRPTSLSTTSHSATAASSKSSLTNSSSPAKSTTVPTKDKVNGAGVPSPIRGVNLGGWLLLESWLNGDLFQGNFVDAVDEWTFDKIPGAANVLKTHWQTYFTEADVQKLASWGINAVRIPIGYWHYHNSVQNTPYISGADYYLEQAIGWCRQNGIKVLIDIHGSPGSQNGFDNSGHAGTVGWQTGNNMEITTNVLVEVATKYGAAQFADTVFAIEMTNEEISWGANDFGKTKTWTQTTYKKMRAAAANKNLILMMHDGFMGPSNWLDVNTALNGNSAKGSFYLDVHLYQNQVAADSKLKQGEHIQKACDYAKTEFLPASSNLPVVVGEFTGATDICANPDGTTSAGKTCSVRDCQCSATVGIDKWKAPLIAATRKFFEVQMQVYETHAQGWFMWTYNGPGAWGLANAVQYGLVGAKVTDRKYTNLCS